MSMITQQSIVFGRFPNRARADVAARESEFIRLSQPDSRFFLPQRHQLAIRWLLLPSRSWSWWVPVQWEHWLRCTRPLAAMMWKYMNCAEVCSIFEVIFHRRTAKGLCKDKGKMQDQKKTSVSMRLRCDVLRRPCRNDTLLSQGPCLACF